MNRLVSVSCLLSGRNMLGVLWFYVVSIRYLYLCCTCVCVCLYMCINTH